MKTTAPKKEQGLPADLAERLAALAELPQIRSMVETMEGLNARLGQLPTSYFGDQRPLLWKPRPVQASARAAALPEPRARPPQQLKPGQKAELPSAKRLQAERDALVAQKRRDYTAALAERYGVSPDTIVRRLKELQPKPAKKKAGAATPDPSSWIRWVHRA